jgi:bifunctional DNA-binding transcriptional regulator/antitoxin component of YhaV-PrlF toxin-antitoxin module
MRSTIAAGFRSTLPKDVRERLNLSVSDVIDWQLKEGRVVVCPVRRNFLAYRNSVRVGAGDIRGDIEEARKQRGEKER